jgi:bifunctional non-homologous end joining protein LigD
MQSLTGEIVALDEKGRSSFQLLQDVAQEEAPIVYYAFDLLRLNGKNLQALPIEERKAQLEELLKKPPAMIRYSVSFTKDIEELLGRARELGLEGLIGKRAGSRYEAGKRTGAWIKLKLHLEQEFVIGGYTDPEGGRKYFGSLRVGFYEGKNLKFAGRVGTGFSDQLLRSLYSDLEKIRIEQCPFFNVPAVGRSRWDQGLTAAEMRRCHWVKPIMVCQVKFTEWTRDDRLRQPVFLGLREDKKASEVMREKAT